MRYARVLFMFLFFCASLAFAEDYNFQKDADGIVKALTQPKYSKTRSFGVSQKTRGFTIVKEVDKEPIKEQIFVAEDEPVTGVNIKIEFDYNSYKLRNDSIPVLQELGKALMDDKIASQTLIVKGHTDGDGTKEFNLKLSFDRAYAVKEYLISNYGITEDRLQVMGYGEEMPLVPNDSNENKTLNRRVEVSLDN